ncbi:MAG: metal ABC transporter permease [Alphaproteobacteria bacterium]
MLDDFLVRAMVAGVGVALVAGPLGCFIVWRRMAYFGDTMAHSALLGVALALLLEIDPVLGIFATTTAVALVLVLLSRNNLVSADALLGILAHASLALGLVAIAFVTNVRVDLLGYLFGDVLSVSKTDIAIIYGGGALVLGGLALIWRPLLAGTIDAQVAAAEGLRPARARAIFTVLMAALIAIAIKIVGVVLITSLLIIPASAARHFASGPERMAVLASVLGAGAVVAGLLGSLYLDTPSGPSIVVAATLLFLGSLALKNQSRSGI